MRNPINVILMKVLVLLAVSVILKKYLPMVTLVASAVETINVNPHIFMVETEHNKFA